MKSLCIVILLLVELWPILVFGMKLSDCEDYQYLLNGDSRDCRECPACPAGQMYTKHCGYQQDHHGNITKPRDSCQSCKSGETFKSEKSDYECRQCTFECGMNRNVVYPCNATHNLKCSDCKKGEYMENGGCYPCKHCCGKAVFTDQFRNEFVKEKCVLDGMGDCACGPILGCNKKCNNPVLLKLSTPKPTSRIHTEAISLLSTPKPVHTKITTDLTTTSKPNSMSAQKGRVDAVNREGTASVDPGWLVAGAVCVLLVSVIVLAILKHLNIIKKIKVLMLNYDTSTRDSRDQIEDENTVVCVSDRFQAPAPPVITNYAQRVDSEDSSQTEHSILIHHPNVQDESHNFVCSCYNSDECTVSSADSTNVMTAVDADSNAPWVYRDDFQHRKPKRWPHTRSEMSNNAAVMYGEYIRLLQDETNSPTIQSNDSEQQPDDLSDDNCTGNQAVSGDQENPENKEGEEHSEGEDTSTAVPVTGEAGQGDNTVVIATGQHVGRTCQDTAKSSDMPREPRAREKRKKKQSTTKVSKKVHGDLSKELPSESLQCSCEKCSYRPYVRNVQLCNCSNCVPQPYDDLYKIIERHCLRAEICKELNKKGVSNWRELSIYMRIDKQIPDIENNKNPAHIVLERLKTSRPTLKLEDFSVILKKIGRQDIMNVIMNHHISCVLCKRNSFDGSLHDVHSKSDSWSLRTLSDSF